MADFGDYLWLVPTGLEALGMSDLWPAPMGGQALVGFVLGRRRAWRASTLLSALLFVLPVIFVLNPDPFYERFMMFEVFYVVGFVFYPMMIAGAGAIGYAIGRWA